MKTSYASQNSTQGVTFYEVEGDSIVLEFRHGRFRYLYNGERPGLKDVTEMIRLARLGKGLSTYVSQHVRDRYAARLAL